MTLQILMIIKGLCGRYERWNPVHPTHGAFWGMGIGLGCGVGWGPGFGPEVVGYVGAGCGFGFSVGITLAGFGVGLPANRLLAFPYNAAMATRSGALDLFARSNSLLGGKNVGGVEWNNIVPRMTDLQRYTSGKISCFNLKSFSDKGVDLIQMKNVPRHILEGCGRFGSRFFRPHKGLKD